MKAKLIFNLEDSEEKERFIRAVKADDMYFFIWELIHNGWRKFKHTDYDYEPAWKRIHELLKEHNINLEELEQ